MSGKAEKLKYSTVVSSLVPDATIGAESKQCLYLAMLRWSVLTREKKGIFLFHEKYNIVFATFLYKMCSDVNWYMEISGSTEIARE